MEKLQRAIVVAVANLTGNFKADRRKLGLSVISLFVATVVLITTCLCWYSMTGVADSGTMTVNAGNGLILNGGAGSSVLTIENAQLIPASSVDGYNLYFPSDGSFADAEGNMSESNMVFRRANAGDKNVNFIQVDFTLASQTDNAEVILDTGSSIKLSDGQDSSVTGEALRVAIISGLANEPKIVNPTDSQKTNQAISSVSRFTGEFRGTSTQTSLPISSGQSVISLKNGETSNISIIIWLEGTDEKCVSSIAGSNLEITLNLTSST